MSEFEKALDEAAATYEPEPRLKTRNARDRRNFRDGANWARSFTLDSPEVRGLKEALKNARAALSNPDELCGDLIDAALEAARTSGQPGEGEGC